MAEEPTGSVSPALTGRERTAAGGVGGALLIVGVVGVFVAKNGTATAVVLVIAAVLVIMCISGYAMTRLKVGDYEVALEKQRLSAARQAFASGDEEKADEIVTSLVRDPPGQAPIDTEHMFWSRYTAIVDRDTRQEAFTASAYVRAVLEAVVGLLPDAAVHEEFDTGLSRLDAFIVVNGRAIGLEVRAGAAFNARLVAERMSAVFAYARPELAGLLVVVRASPNTAQVDQLRTAIAKLGRPVEIVTWTPGSSVDDSIMLCSVWSDRTQTRDRLLASVSLTDAVAVQARINTRILCRDVPPSTTPSTSSL